MKQSIHLGFEVSTGTPVAIPLGHMAVTGMTQQAGKTTTLEALIARSGLRAIAFVTKRGEASFADAKRIPPYFRERADWVFVASLIDATLAEKNKILRAWLMKVCRNTKTLAEVQRNVKAAKESARGFAESIYTEIEGYLELVVPQIAELPPARGIKLAAGLNVMDLSPYTTALQALVIRSALDHVYEHEEAVVTVIPEAWEFLPEGRGSPVKQGAETLIRKGGGLQNFMWIDSQDMAGVWKLALRAAPLYLIGVQREANEIRRTLANIPGSIAKPKAADVATLELGQFYACWSTHAIKTYVQPVWMDPDQARAVAMGQAEPAWPQRSTTSLRHTPPPEAASTAAAIETESEDIDVKELEEISKKLDQLVELVRADWKARSAPFADTLKAVPTTTGGAARPAQAPGGAFDEDALYERFKERLVAEAPGLLRLLTSRPEIEVSVERRVLEVDEGSLRGQLALLILGGFFDEPVVGYAAYTELTQRRKFKIGKINVYNEMKEMVRDGFLRTEDGKRYVKAAGAKIVKHER